MSGHVNVLGVSIIFLFDFGIGSTLFLFHLISKLINA